MACLLAHGQCCSRRSLLPVPVEFGCRPGRCSSHSRPQPLAQRQSASDAQGAAPRGGLGRIRRCRHDFSADRRQCLHGLPSQLVSRLAGAVQGLCAHSAVAAMSVPAMLGGARAADWLADALYAAEDPDQPLHSALAGVMPVAAVRAFASQPTLQDQLLASVAAGSLMRLLSTLPADSQHRSLAAESLQRIGREAHCTRWGFHLLPEDQFIACRGSRGWIHMAPSAWRTLCGLLSQLGRARGGGGAMP